MTATTKPNKKNIIKLQNFISNYGVHKPQPNTQHNQTNQSKS